MFETEVGEWADEMYPCDGQAQRYLIEGAEFGYNKAIEELKQAKKLLEKWLFFNVFNSALKKETEDFLGKKTEEIEIPKGVEEIKWQRKNLKNN